MVNIFSTYKHILMFFGYIFQVLNIATKNQPYFRNSLNSAFQFLGKKREVKEARSKKKVRNKKKDKK